MQRGGRIEGSRPVSAARRGAVTPIANEALSLSPAGSRRASLALSENLDDAARSPSPSLSQLEAGSPNGSRRPSLAAGMTQERQLMNLAIEAHKQKELEKQQAQLAAVDAMNSKVLSVFLKNAITGNMSKWSRAAKKAFLLTEVTDTSRYTRASVERTQLKVSLLTAIMNSACICLQCASSRLLENARDAEVARQQLKNLMSCCDGFNLTLSNGKCGNSGSVASAACIVDPTLIVSTDTDFAVAYGTPVFWLSFYLNASVSALSFLSVIAIFYYAILSRKVHAFSKHLEKNIDPDKVDTSALPVFTSSFWAQILLVLIHMPPLPFDIPVLEFQHPYYTESKLLKYPWIALLSAIVTLRVFFILKYIRDRTIIQWSTKRRIVERQTGIKVDAIFVLKVLMSEAPMTVVCGSCVAIFGILTYWMLVFERNSEWLRTFQDSLWLIVITAFTIGYGDIYPRTFFGRAIAIVAGILGVIFAALGTAALSNKLAWTTAEYNVSKLLLKSVMEKKVAYQAVVYLQRTFRRITNRAPNNCWTSRETTQRRDRDAWIQVKQEFNAFKQNQHNMELLLKDILEDSGKISKVTQFLNNHDATKEWITTVTKGSNHPLQLQVSVNLLEEQLKNLESLALAELEKQKARNDGLENPSAVVKRDRVVDPNDSVVDSLILELNSLSDVLDENNKDLDWFANEINNRVRGQRFDDGPRPFMAALPEPQRPILQQQQFSQGPLPVPITSHAQNEYIPGQVQPNAASESIALMQQQAALQMQMQTALLTKLVQALDSPRRSRSKSRDKIRSRSHSRASRNGRTASSHSNRSRSREAYNISSSEEDDSRALNRPLSRSRGPKSRPDDAELEQFPADGEVWIDEDLDSVASSRPSSRPISASQPVTSSYDNGALNSNDQATPRMKVTSRRSQEIQRR